MTTAKPLFAIAALVAASAVVAGCETVPSSMGSGGARGAAFNADDFAWSTRTGRASIDGSIDFRRDGQRYDCGAVVLTPDTPYTRARFRTLYGSTDRAQIPEAIVRARTVADPNANYSSFVQQVSCSDGRFAFNDLPDGGWFIIAPVRAGGDRIILMRHVDTRSGRVSVTLP